MRQPSAEVARCLEPQERFEALRAHYTRKTGGRLIDLAYPNAREPLAGVRERIAAAVAAIDGAELQYTPYGGATVPRRAIACSLRRSHLVRFSYEDVVLTPGAMAALSVLFAALREAEGDEIVIVSPCWLDAPTYAYQQGLTPILVPVDREGRLDLDAIERAITPRTRAVLLSQPANPTGVLYSDRELAALAEILGGVLLISDECHSEYVYGERFVSPIARHPRTCVVSSLGKRWLAQGLRLGYAAFSPALRAEGWPARAIRLCRALGHAMPSALLQRALPRLLELSIDRSAFAARRARAVAALSADYAVVPGRHTMFVYASVPNGEDDFAFVERAAEHGVLVMPSSLFHDRGRFRVAVTAGDDALERGLSALARAAQREAA